MVRALAGLLGLLVFAVGVFADEPRQLGRVSLEDIKRIVDKTRDSFWGRAVGEDGKLLQPATEGERRTVLIPDADAQRIVNDAVIYGVALWCGVKWEPVYHQYMQAERKRRWSVKQIAFVGMLFGVAQGTIESSMPRKCTAEEKSKAEARLFEEKQRLKSLHTQK